MKQTGSLLVLIIAVLGFVMGCLAFLRPTPPVQAPPSGATPGNEFTQTVDFQNSFIVSKNVATSTTGTATTLSYKDIKDVDTLFVTPNTADLTYTFFASSTANAFLPKAGNRQTTCIFNATTTAGIDILFAAATGIDFNQVATTTVAGLEIIKIAPQDVGCFNIFRGPSTAAKFDLIVNYTPFKDAD